MEILKLKTLVKHTAKAKNQVKALDNVSFSVNSGEFIAIS